MCRCLVLPKFALKPFSLSLKFLYTTIIQVDLTQYVEKHEFVFDAVLNEEVSNDEVIIKYTILHQTPKLLTAFRSLLTLVRHMSH